MDPDNLARHGLGAFCKEMFVTVDPLSENPRALQLQKQKSVGHNGQNIGFSGTPKSVIFRAGRAGPGGPDRPMKFRTHAQVS